ncbi:hypothetical protein GOARA_006_00280 [Gordonia araii NBRC 100433]|uniref:Uncharacterized protein n=1 Tax=Gordonia araii NBRC 100433 TaxID=1073574 RepID=G7GXE4_9ACTN|nr:hypothetical protein GOARA_006_00280 [Gordonia araii NBRC 100433]
MVHVVERHEHGRSDIARLVGESEEAVGLMMPEVLSHPENTIDFTAGLAQVWTSYCLADDPQAELSDTRRAARLAAQLSADLFVLAGTGAGTRVRIDIGDDKADATGTGPVPIANLTNWLAAYWWSQISRSEDSRAALERFTLDDLTKDGRFDPYWCRMFEALRGFDSDSETWPGAISAAMESIDGPTVSTREESMFLALDLFGLLAAIGDQDEFTQQLRKALESHKTYWTATRERRADPRGFASFAILALAAKAADAGMAIEVESDYLPRGLLERPRWMFELT